MYVLSNRNVHRHSLNHCNTNSSDYKNISPEALGKTTLPVPHPRVMESDSSERGQGICIGLFSKIML